VIDGYSTDGFIARYDLVILQDDRHFFPPYEAAALVGAHFDRELPAGVAALTELSGLLTEAGMRRLNRRIEVDKVPIARVAAAELLALGLTQAGPAQPQTAKDLSTGGVFRYLWNQRQTILSLTLRHLLLVGVSLAGAIALALPLGLALEERSRGVAESVIRAVGLLQTLPSIALL